MIGCLHLQKNELMFVRFIILGVHFTFVYFDLLILCVMGEVIQTW
jgi:hypothetical protein